MKALISSLMILIGGLTAVAGSTVKSDAEWLTQTHAQLAEVKSVTSLTNVGLQAFGDKEPPPPEGRYSCSPRGNGMILFEDKTWVLLVSHSRHTEDGIGDLTLVRTSDGRFLVNKGHVCGNLLLDVREKITSLTTFLKATGKTLDGEVTTWEPYKGEQQGGRFSPPVTGSSIPTP